MNSNVKTVIKTTVTLTLICVFSAVLLAVTNKFTSAKIETSGEESEDNAMNRVIPAETYYDFDLDVAGEKIKYYVADNGGKTVGYIFTVANHGYGGEVEVMIGVGTDGKVAAIEVIDASNETPGLGQKATEKEFWDEFKDKSEGVTVTKEEAAGNEVKAITGATITSNSVTKSVNTALEYYAMIAKEAD